MTTSVGRRNTTGRMTPSNNNNKMKPPSLMLLFVVACCVSVAMSQRTVGDDRPLRFQSFPANPPQSFQQINFFGPLSPQQSGSADPSAVAGSTPNNRQALFFSSQNSGQQDSRNPIFDSRAISPLSTLASSSIGSVQRGQQIRNPTLESGFNPQRQLPSEVAVNAFPSVNSGAARLTPASTSIQQDQQRQKPIVQFQFNRNQVQPMNPAGNFNRLQHPELKLQLLPEIQDFPLPVPIGFRTPFFHQTPPTEVKPLTEGPKPQEPIIEEPLPSPQESVPPQETIEESLPAPVVQEIPDVPPSQIETNEFQRVRPVQQTESLLNFEPASTPRPFQLQVLSDQPEESNNRDSQTNRRNRLRRPLNSDTPATELPNSPRRVPPVRESNPNLRPVLVDDTPVPTTASVRQRFRSTTIAAPLTTTEAEEQQAVTIRTRTPFLRPRPTNPTISRTRTNFRLFTTTSQTEEEITTRAPATTNRFFGGRRPIRPSAVESEEPATEILITTTQKTPTTTTAGRVRSNFRFNSPEQAGTTTVKSVRFNSPEQSQTVQSPVLPVVQADVDTLVNSVNDNNNGPSSVDQQQETPTELISKPEEEATDVTTIEPEVEYYYDDVVDEVDVQLTNDSQSSTTVATIPEIPSSAAPLQEISVEAVEIPAPIEVTEAIATAVEQPVVENDHKPIIDEPIIQHEQVTDVAQPPMPIDEPTAVIPIEEVEGPTTDAEQIVVEEEQAPTSSIATPQQSNNNNGPSKLKIFNLGRRNTSSVNLDNIVFVPNLDGFVLPTNPVTPNTISVETSRSVTVVKMSVDQLPTESPSLLPAGDRQSKAIASKTDNLANSLATDGKQPPIKEAEQAGESLLPEPTTKVPENRNDELDLIQSDLFDKHLNNNFNMEANKAASNTSTTTTATPPTSSRTPFRPAFKRPFDLLPTTTAIPVTEQVVAASSSTTTTEVAAVSSTTTESSVATTIAAEVTTLSLFDRLFGKKVVVMDDISSLLPPGFSPPKEEEVLTEAPVTKVVAPVTEPAAPVTEIAPKEAELAPEAEAPVGPPVNPLDKIFGSVKVDDVSAFLPPGFKMEQPPTTESPTTTTTTAKNPFAGLFDTANMDDLSGLLPSNFKNHLFTPSPSKTTATSTVTESSSVVAESSTASPSSEPSTTTAKKGLVFPTRASPARTTTSEKPKVKPTQPGVEIKSGWPVRATTEFTGWPSPPTQPYTPPSTTSTTARTTTTTTRTTTTTTPRVTTVGQCGEECRLAGTIRLVDGIDWMPELSDHNTREWYQLAAIVENSLDAVYQSGPLAPWYAGIVVEAFSRGSVLVDYYLNLNGTTILDTGEIRNYFHMSLDKEGESYKLGNYTVDTKSTDFIVLRQPVVSGEKQRVVTGGVGEWVIAVIVVGLASLIFVIAFGTTMLIRRRRQHQRKPLPLTEEMLNELNKNHMSCADNTGTDSFYNDEVGDAWDHRTNFPTKPIKTLPRPASVSAIHQSNRTHGSSGGASYNYNHYTNYNNFRPQLHDSWKSEWDSSYYDTSNSGTAPRSSKTAPTRPATSYGRYPTYGRSRPSNFHDDF